MPTSLPTDRTNASTPTGATTELPAATWNSLASYLNSLRLEAWSSANTYGADSVVWYQGHAWRAVTSSTNVPPGSDGSTAAQASATPSTTIPVIGLTAATEWRGVRIVPSSSFTLTSFDLWVTNTPPSQDQTIPYRIMDSSELVTLAQNNGTLSMTGATSAPATGGFNVTATLSTPVPLIAGRSYDFLFSGRTADGNNSATNTYLWARRTNAAPTLSGITSVTHVSLIVDDGVGGLASGYPSYSLTAGAGYGIRLNGRVGSWVPIGFAPGHRFQHTHVEHAARIHDHVQPAVVATTLASGASTTGTVNLTLNKSNTYIVSAPGSGAISVPLGAPTTDAQTPNANGVPSLIVIKTPDAARAVTVTSNTSGTQTATSVSGGGVYVWCFPVGTTDGWAVMAVPFAAPTP